MNRVFSIAAMLLTAVTTGVYAQQSMWWTIATDYNTCLSGMKDKEGTWMIEPRYETIRSSQYGYFIVSIGGKYGVLDEKGKATVPLVYDDVKQLYTTSYDSRSRTPYFIIRQNEKSGMVDSVNNIVIPIIYEQVIFFPDGTLAATKGKSDWELYQLDGTHFPVPWKSKQAPESPATHCYIFSRKLPLCKRKWGMVNDSGRVLLERDYDGFSGFRRRKVIRVTKNDQYGYCSDAGKMIWPVVFTYKQKNQPTVYDYTLAEEHGIGPAIFDNLYGLISIEGDTLLPFIYDNIHRFQANTYNRFGPQLWVVEKDGKSGMFDDEKGWVVPAECEQIITVTGFHVLSDSSTVGLLVVNKNGLWGAITTSGQEIIPCRYEEYLDQKFNSYLFRKKDSVIALSVCRPEIRNTMLKRNGIHGEESRLTDSYTGKQVGTAPESKMYSRYNGLYGSTAFYFPRYWGKTVETSNRMYKFDQGQYHGFCVPDTVLLATAFSVQPAVKLLNTKGNVQFYGVARLDHPDSVHVVEFCVITDSMGRKNMVAIEDSEQSGSRSWFMTADSDLIRDDGKILVDGDTVFFVEAIHPVTTGELFFRVGNYKNGTTFLDSTGKTVIPWTKHTPSFFSGPYLWEEVGDDQWRLVNYKTGEQITPKKMYNQRPHPIWNNTTILNDDKHGKRLYNVSSRAIITPAGFDLIEPLNAEGTLFAVKTCSGKMGVIDHKGTWFTDTLWTARTPVEFVKLQDLDEGNYYSQVCIYRYHVFYNDTSNITIDGQTGQAITEQQSLTVRWNASLKVRARQYPSPHSNDSCSSREPRRMYLYIPKTDTHRILPWHRECILDSIFTPIRPDKDGENEYDSPCDYCYDRGFEDISFEWTKNHPNGSEFATAHVADSVVSFYHSSCDYYWSSDSPQKNLFSTVMMFPEGPRQIILDSLFNPANDWKNFIINTVINYVNTNPGVHGDCHNPASLPEMLRQSFLVTAEGLELYPEGFIQYSAQLVIVVPWKDVDPYLRSDVRSKLPNQNQKLK